MLDALTLDQMRMFKAVADTGSFRMAATHLGRAQSPSVIPFPIWRLSWVSRSLTDRATARP